VYTDAYGHRAVIAWERVMREGDGAAASTVRRRLAALSSLFKHLVRYGFAEKNPVSEVERPAINREQGSTLAFSKAEAAKFCAAAQSCSTGPRRKPWRVSVTGRLWR
jgi:site-specific recombinase XerD